MIKRYTLEVRDEMNVWQAAYSIYGARMENRPLEVIRIVEKRIPSWMAYRITETELTEDSAVTRDFEQFEPGYKPAAQCNDRAIP